MSFGDKENVLGRLEQAVREGGVDEGVMKVLDSLNAHDDYYTTSSCEGRVQLIQVAEAGDKQDSVVLGKWHGGAGLEELTGALEDWDGAGYVYLLSQSPIFHVKCRDLASAVRLQQAGFDSGFRYSTIRSMKLKDGEPASITVELLTSFRVDAPLGRQGILFPDRDYLAFILDRCNSVLDLAKQKLSVLEERTGAL